MSLSREIEQLQNRRAELEKESCSLEEQQKDLDNRVKMLEEKIAIEELRNGNKAKQETINQLKSKMNELEQRLRKVSGEPNSFGPTSEAVPEVVETPKPIEEPMDVSEPVQEEPEEEAVTVTALEEPMAAEQEEIGESLNRQHEKKKRRFL